ncbi:hypothetical protein [Comamonas sp. NoAH]|uniref:hypothetical protein n=1 Tax=Comamonas halotolerans TaxID=3041496 RepID=UPI0024E05575|nr:hypothetical protein [Comamonas sp. NoAH]
MIEIHSFKQNSRNIVDLLDNLASDIFTSHIAITKRTGSNHSIAKKGAIARHKENHKIKAEVFEWLDKNMHTYKSMDAAATAIAGKEVPMAFRTVRQWITEWKKLRAASKA